MISRCFTISVLPLLVLQVVVHHAAAASNTLCTKDGDAPHPDLMSYMPGLNQPFPSNWYSGYLDYEFQGRQVHTHYVLVEAEDNAAGDKPLIYWSNGGPGASSLFGLLTELGPLLLSDESLETEDYKTTGIPTPIYNPYTWSRLGHLLIIDQPAPVGFSYCQDEPDSHSCGGIAWTDELASANAYTALQTFFDQKFSCLQNLPLYLTGESYGGIYIPTLARHVYNDKDTNGMQLQGFAVGDGCLGVETTMCGSLSKGGGVFRDYWHVLFMAGHHQIPLADFRMVMKACASHDERPDFLTTNSQEDEACKQALQQIKTELGGYFEYSLYDECTYRNGLLQKRTPLKGALNDYPCGGGPVMKKYFQMAAVKDAFHVKGTFFEVDNAEGDFDYTPTEPNLSGFYQEVNGKLRVLIYNGDTDPAITSFATSNWTSNLGFTETQHWRPWTVDGCRKTEGYVTRYQGDFDFLTIRGAGHMVPTYKPAATFAFMQAWFLNQNYLPFDAKCTQPSMNVLASSLKMKHRVTTTKGVEEEEVFVDTNMLRG